MSDVPQTLTTILNNLALDFRPRVVRAINRRSVLLTVLPIVMGSGKNVTWDIETSGANAETFNDGDDASNFNSDAIVAPTLGWGLVRSNFRVGDVAVAAAASASSPRDLMGLISRNYVNSTTALTSSINSKLFSSSSGIIGLDTALRDDNTYAGIDRTDSANTLARGNLIDPGSLTAPTLSDIRKDITVTIYKACGVQPDIAICSPEVFLAIGNLFQEFRRLNQDAKSMDTARGTVQLDGSLGSIEFEGCRFFKDKDATANRIYYLNTEYVRVEYLPQLMSPEVMEQSRMVQADDGYGANPLGMKAKALAPTGASSKVSLQAFLQLVVERPNACGMRLNVAA